MEKQNLGYPLSSVQPPLPGVSVESEGISFEVEQVVVLPLPPRPTVRRKARIHQVRQGRQDLGHFVPLPQTPSREPKISEEELQRRLQAGGGRSLAAILSDLEKR